jgi:DNA (cytosine-5)-methyltransferase 1
LKCISLFSGCGGLDLGLSQAGFQVILAADNDKRCVESYKLNFPGSTVFAGSATQLSKVTLEQLCQGKIAKGVDLLAGGPPCPPYSKSRFYRTEKPRGLEDPVGNETLAAYLKTLKIVKPKAFLLENVPGFSYEIQKQALELTLRTAEALGYTCTWKVLNAADYGIPQIRERFFLIGLRKGSFVFPEQTHAQSPGDTLFNQKAHPWVTAGEAIGDLDTPENADDKGHFAGGKHHELLTQIPPGENYLFFTKERGHPNPIFKWRSRYWSFLLKLSPKLPSWTIQARRSNNMGPLHWRNRILRISEVKRLQTFPDTWHLSGTVEQQWRQVGNAVPPLLAKRLGEAIVKSLASKPQRTLVNA